MSDNPLESQFVRRLFGIISGFVIAFIGFIYFEGMLLLIVLGAAAVEAVLVPYFLGLMVEHPVVES